jgi:pseudouridine synthase
MIQERAASMEEERGGGDGGADADASFAIVTQHQQQQQQQQQQLRQHLHLKMYKPAKVLSQFVFNHRKRRTRTLLGDYVKAVAGGVHDDGFPNNNVSGIMAIGRLDEDSEGLLLLTTDGKVSERIRRRSVEKEYWVQVDGRISDDAIERLRRGVEIRLPSSSSCESGGRFVKYITLPCSVRILETVLVEKTKNYENKVEDSKPISIRKMKFKGKCNTCGKDGHKARECDQNPAVDTLQLKEGGCETMSILVALPPGIPPSSRVATRDDARHGPTSWISIAIAEGKNRQVRRMTAAVGHVTLRLVRVRIGPIVLDGMEEGEVRVLAQSDVDAIDREY